MNTHYLTTSRRNPQLYIFRQRIAGDVVLTAANWERTQQEAWAKFWEGEGLELLQVKWHKDYPEYKEQIDSVTLEDRAAWQVLWEDYATQVNTKFWHIFSCVYENYQRDLIKSLDEGNDNAVEAATVDLAQLDLDTKPKKRSDKTKLKDEEEEEEHALLELLGLPSAFGTKKPHRQKAEIVELSDSDNDLTMPKDDAPLHGVQARAIKKQRKKQRKLNANPMPDYMLEDNTMIKYWFKRFSLFSRFDQGIRLDRESWFSVTPEKIAKQTARRLACDLIVDGFCGCGGNAIQFALTCGQVIAVDIDAEKLAMAKHNAAIYGVAHRIEFVHADFLQFARSSRLRPDVVFLSPPWGGPKYLKQSSFDIEQCLLPLGATQLMEHARRLSNNVGFFLPRNSKMPQIIRLASVGQQCEVEHNYLDTRLVALTAYYGQKLIKHQEDKKKEGEGDVGEENQADKNEEDDDDVGEKDPNRKEEEDKDDEEEGRI